MDADQTGFLQRLRRRKVVQWGIAYVAAAWGLLQGLAYLGDTFGGPPALQQYATLLSIVGLPVALVLAWYHGDRGHQRVSGTEFAILTALLLLGGGMFAWLGAVRSGPAATDEQPEPAAAAAPVATDSSARSLAVLPFENRSAAEDDAYFAEGMHDDLLSQLAKLRDVRVISRTSVQRYAETDKTIPQIAAELGVSTVLEGGVQRAGDRVRINVQLIDARTDAHLWSESFDRQLTVDNLLDIQSEITRAIAGSLEAVLVGAGSVPDDLPTRSIEAYNAYLLGNTLSRYDAPDPDQYARATEAYAEAIRLDPLFAAAHARKAVAHLTSAWWNIDAVENLRLAEAALARARELAPDATETLIAQAAYLYWGRLDYAGAQAVLEDVLKRAPQDARLWDLLAAVSRRSGDLDAAVQAYEKAVALDPLSSSGALNLAHTYAYLGRLAEARQMLSRAIAVAPESAYVQMNLDIAERLLADPEALWHQYEAARTKSAVAPGWVDMSYSVLVYSLRDPARLEILQQRLAEVRFDSKLILVDVLTRRAEALAKLGRTEEAMALARHLKAEVESHGLAANERGRAEALLIWLDAFLGNEAQVRARLRQMPQLLAGNPLWLAEYGWRAAAALARIGEADAALDIAEQLMDQYSPAQFWWMYTGTEFDGLRELPRYQALEARYLAWRAQQPPAPAPASL
jgi:TolB-like protein/lipoprotein NlpI